MGPRRQAEAHAPPSPREVAAIVATLESRHGALAAQIAEFFATSHRLEGDTGRSWVWATVAATLRHRAEARGSGPTPLGRA